MGGSGGGAPPDPTALRQAYDGARGTSFNGGWRFNLGDPAGAQQNDFNDGAWTSLTLPHDWSPALGMSQSSPGGASEGFSIGGVGWYRKTFALDSSYAGKRILIEFDGVYYNSEVWINGTSLGKWPYGYTTFQYDLTPYVKTDGSKNVVAVRVNNQQPSSRWYTGSGIYRNVWLTILNPVHIAYCGGFITTPMVTAASATVSVATEVENQSASSSAVTVKATITDAAGTVVATGTSAATDVAAGGKGTVTQSLTVGSPKLWSPDSPTLYQATVELVGGGQTVDTYVVPMGFRWYGFDPAKGFSLNGQSMKIWGQSMHHDLGAIGSAVNVRALQRQIQLLKGMGMNGIRTAHNPPAPELLALTDAMGMLVMDEAFDVWETGKEPRYDYHTVFTEWAQRDIQAQVRRDRNHPSVIMWSIGNEIQQGTVATATKLRDWVKALDTTRPVTWACNDMANATNQQIAALLDLQGYNYQSGRLDGDHAAHPTWKMFGSETTSGAWSRGYYPMPKPGPKEGCNSSVQQCFAYDDGDSGSVEEMYAIDASRPYYAGQFQWSGFDYGGEPFPFRDRWPSKSSYWGIVDLAGFPKDIYYFYQSKLTTKPMVHVAPHWNWSGGTTVTVQVWSNCESVELFVNGKSQGPKPIGPSTLHLQWNVPWEPGTLRADCTRGGAVAASQEVKTAGAASQVRLTADRTEIAADGRDLVYVTAEIADADGVFVPTATNSLAFAVSGAGKLIAVDNGDATDTTPYVSPTRKAWSGKALAVVQSTGAPGPIMVTATSSQLSQGSASATAK